MVKIYSGICPLDNEPAQIIAEFHEVKISRRYEKAFNIVSFDCQHRINCEATGACPIVAKIPKSVNG